MSYLKAKREAPYTLPLPPLSPQRTKRSCALGFVIDSRYKKWFIRTRRAGRGSCSRGLEWLCCHFWPPISFVVILLVRLSGLAFVVAAPTSAAVEL